MNYRPFDNDVPTKVANIDFVRSASELTDEELMQELVDRGAVAMVYGERIIPLKDTMYLPHEREARRNALRHEIATLIGLKLLENQTLTETISVNPENGTHVQTYRLSGHVCVPKG